MIRYLQRLTLASVFVFVVSSTAHAQWTPEGGILLRGKVATMDAKNTVKEASLLIRNGKIEEILPIDAPVPEGAIAINTKGVIYPGLMNLHNHLTYDFLPLYETPKKYDNRNQWPGVKQYQRDINNPKTIVTDSKLYDLQTEALKYANIKEIVGGTTTVQGGLRDAGATNQLIRNVEGKNFENDNVGSDVLGMSDALVASKDRIAKTSAFFFHLAEGVDEKSRLEYSNPDYNPRKPMTASNTPGLKEAGLLLKNLVAIHATGLKPQDFKDWAKIIGEGPKIVWSPLSNLLLYGETTDVLAARKAGAVVALGTDWTPSGSKSLLWEMKVADQYSRQKLNGALSEEDIVRMVTTNPAKIMGWEDKVGMIKKGMVADLVVMDDMGKNAYRNLIDSVESNVKLVMVGGDPRYGDASIMTKLKGEMKSKLEALDELAKRPKLLDLRRDVRDGQETLKQIVNAISVAAKMNPKTLAKALNDGDPTEPKDPYAARTAMKKWLTEAYKKDGLDIPASLKNESYPITENQVADYLDRRFPAREPLKMIDSIFQQNDDRFFERLVTNLNLAGDSPVVNLNGLDQYRSGKDAPTPAAVAKISPLTRTTGMSSLINERVGDAAKGDERDAEER
ncbi:MAG TPA: amidohydrolase family protein [Planctomycetota bacterium]|nr:amidohydrolase family protein [Planctomycetota bacterium]